MKATTDPPSASPENDVIPPPAPPPQTINGEWYQIIILFASQVLMHMKLWQSNKHTFPSASSTASHLLQLKTLLAKEQVQYVCLLANFLLIFHEYGEATMTINTYSAMM